MYYNRCTVAISNYMAYLLNFRPNMLMTGSRQHLFSEAKAQMEESTLLVDNEGRLNIKGCANNKEACSQYPIIYEAWELAEQLAELDDNTRWELLYHVWMGMLCYSASMCRGYEHAKSLGEGGEFLSYVWLIITLKGCMTLADKLQLPDQRHDDGGGTLKPVMIDLLDFIDRQTI